MLQSRCATSLGALNCIVGRPIAGAAGSAGAGAGAAGAGGAGAVSGVAAASGDGASVCGGCGVVAAFTCGWTLGFGVGLGGTGFGGTGVGVDWMATGAATGCGGAELISAAVIVLASIGRGGASLRWVSSTTSNATWIATTTAMAAIMRRFMPETSAVRGDEKPTGEGAGTFISAWSSCSSWTLLWGATRAASGTGRRHFRKISREINSVVTKPISNSIIPSGDGAAWLGRGDLAWR